MRQSFLVEIDPVINLFNRYDERVTRSNRFDRHEGNAHIVAIHEVCGEIPSDDHAEYCGHSVDSGTSVNVVATVAYALMKRASILQSLWLADVAWLLVAILIATRSVFGVWMPWLATTPTGTMMPLVGLVLLGAWLAIYVTYRSGETTVQSSSFGQVLAIVFPTLAVTAFGLVLSREYWSRSWLLTVFGLWIVFMLIHRLVSRMSPWTEDMVVITDAKSLADGIANSPNANVVAVVEPDGDPSDVPLADGITLVVDLRSSLSPDMARLVSSASVSGQRVRPLVDVYEEYTGRLPLIHIVRGWELTRPVARSKYSPVKRVVDLVTVVLTSFIWVPLMAITWVMIRLDSPGPAMYRQVRVGKSGQLFTLRKFRTMVPDAEIDGPQFAQKNDPRLTRVGGFLRRSRLDELPQIWNVVVGDLAVVGPRPERPMFVERFSEAIPFYQSRHLVRPGITGWAQVQTGYGDSDEDAFDKLTYDLYYVKYSSIWLDLRILGKSVWTVLTGAGAR